MKICPDCQTRHDDGIEVCPYDGEALVDLPEELARDPRPNVPPPSLPSERTSMIDLEAIEAMRKPRASASEDTSDDASDDASDNAGNGDEDDRTTTTPPDGPPERDHDATGTYHANAARAMRRARRAKDRVPAAAPEQQRDAASGLPREDEAAPGTGRLSSATREAEPTGDADDRAPSGGGTRTGMTRAGTRTGMTRAGTRTGMTRAGTRTALRQPAPPVANPRRSVTAWQAGFLALVVVLAVVGGVVLVARATAVLTVTTVPPGAVVTLDGEVIGQSPIQKRVRTGSHTVELALAGFHPFKEVVSVPVGGLPFLQPLQREPSPPPPPPTTGQIAEELVKAAAAGFAGGDAELAKRKLDEAIALMPDYPAAMALLPAVDAALAARRNDLRRSEAAATREARLRQARVLAAEGRTLYDAGRLGPAKEKLYASLKLNAENPEPHRTLGRIFNREEQVEKVRYHLQRFLDLGGADADFKVREWLKAHPR